MKNILIQLKGWFKKLSNTQKAILLLAVILVFFSSKNMSNSTNDGQVENQQSVKPLDRSTVYIIAQQFAKEHLGSADYGWADDGFTDYGDGTFHVTGVADIPGKRIRWTIELKYKGGDVWDNRNWVEKNWIAQ